MEILKKIYSQYEVYIEGLELNTKKMIAQKIRVMKLCERNLNEYEAVFNICYVNLNNKAIIMKAFGKTEDEAIKKLENIILKNKMKFREEKTKEIFY